MTFVEADFSGYGVDEESGHPPLFWLRLYGYCTSRHMLVGEMKGSRRRSSPVIEVTLAMNRILLMQTKHKLTSIIRKSECPAHPEVTKENY